MLCWPSPRCDRDAGTAGFISSIGSARVDTEYVPERAAPRREGRKTSELESLGTLALHGDDGGERLGPDGDGPALDADRQALEASCRHRSGPPPGRPLS